MRRFVLLAALLGAAAGAALVGCTGSGSQQAAGGKRVILLTNGNSPFWDAARAGLKEAEKDLNLKEAGLQAVFEVNDMTPKGQLDHLRQYASQDDVVAVAVSAVDANNVAVADQMRELKKKGVHIICVDSDVDRDKMRDARFAFIGTDNLTGGVELGKCARGLRPDGGAYVTFVGRTGAQNAIERVGGFAKGAGDKFKAVDNMGDSGDLNKARENVRNAIRNHPEVNTLVGIWSYNAPAIVDVVRDTDRRKDFTVVAFDAEPAAIEEMGKGMIDAMVVQNPYKMGYDSVKLMKALVEDDRKTIDAMFPDKDKKPDGDVYDTGLKVVVPDEGSPLTKEAFGPTTEFLKLGEFRKWLEKYNLKGS